MSRCPYCGGTTLDVVTTVRKRHPLHTTVRCGACAGYAVRHAHGRVYPLADRTNRESDSVSKVVDGG